MDIAKCYKKCKWLEHIPKKNRYGDVEHFCLLSGTTIFSKDTERKRKKIEKKSVYRRKGIYNQESYAA